MNNDEQTIVEETQVVDETDTQGQAGNEAGKQDDESKAGRAVEKLQKRLSVVSEEKNNFKAQNEELQAKNAELLKQLEDLKNDKTVKELSDEEKAQQADKAKDDEIKQLKAQLARTQALQDTNEILKEQGYNVPGNVLDLVVSNDNEKTVANTKSLLAFVETVKADVRTEVLKGTTPKKTGVKPGNAFADALGLN